MKILIKLAARINKEPVMNNLILFLNVKSFVSKIKIASKIYAVVAIHASINLNSVLFIIIDEFFRIAL